MKNKNLEDCSSLKFFNFQGWTHEKIIDKYENVLASREKQITDLSIEIGSLNDRVSQLSDNLKNFQDENEILKTRLQKRENILNQELNNKEIMFMRMERIEQECDELKKKLEKYESKGIKEMKELRRPSDTNNVQNAVNNIKNEFGLQVEDQAKDNKIVISQRKSEIAETPAQLKPSALDKIRELKERKKDKNNRINLTSSVIEGAKNTSEIPQINNISITSNNSISEQNIIASNNELTIEPENQNNETKNENP